MNNENHNSPGLRLLKTIGAYAGATVVAAASLGLDYLYFERVTGRTSDFPDSGAFGAGTFAVLALTYLAVKSFEGANDLRHELDRSARHSASRTTFDAK